MLVDFTASSARIESLREHSAEFTPRATLVERMRLLPHEAFAEIIVTAIEESR